MVEGSYKGKRSVRINILEMPDVAGKQKHHRGDSGGDFEVREIAEVIEHRTKL